MCTIDGPIDGCSPMSFLSAVRTVVTNLLRESRQTKVKIDGPRSTVIWREQIYRRVKRSKQTRHSHQGSMKSLKVPILIAFIIRW